MMKSETCKFEFVPSEWEEEHSTKCEIKDELLEKGRWVCPHKRGKESEYCPFHSPPGDTNPTEITEAFKTAVENRTNANSSREVERSRRFIGARIDDLFLRYAHLGTGSNYPIDLRYSEIEGTLDLEYATVDTHLKLEGSEINEFIAHDCDFKDRFDASGSVIGEADLRSANFEDRANFSDINVDYLMMFNTNFNERAIFSRTNIIKTLSAKNTHFYSDVWFTDSVFNKKSLFSAAKFHGEAIFDDIELQAPISFSNADFKSGFEFEPDFIAENVHRIDMSKCTMEEGYIRIPSDDDIIIDLSKSTLSEVSLGEKEPATTFNKCKLIETEFDGFDFSKYTDILIKRNFLIHLFSKEFDNHSYEGGYQLPFVSRFRQRIKTVRREHFNDSKYTPGELRSTYLKAKNGAENVGDDSAAAEFFIHEMRYKRKSYIQTFKDNSSIRALFQWVFNWGYNLTAGYGERPFRTVISSFALVLVFALIYISLAPLTPISAVAFSFQAFVSLVLGEPVGESRFPLLAAFEAFVGGFMIALFVFTLTRSINR